MMVQFAHILADTYRKERGQDIEVYVWSKLDLNGRPMLQFIDPTVNLVAEKRTLGHQDWIIPLDQAQPVDPPVVPRCPPRPKRAN